MVVIAADAAGRKMPRWKEVSLDGSSVKTDRSEEGVGESELSVFPTVLLGGSSPGHSCH